MGSSRRPALALPLSLLLAVGRAQAQLTENDPRHTSALLRGLALTDDGGQTSVPCNTALIGTVGGPVAGQGPCAAYVWDNTTSKIVAGGSPMHQWVPAGNIDPIWNSYFPKDNRIPLPTAQQLQPPYILGDAAGQAQPMYALHAGLGVTAQRGWGGGPNISLAPPNMTVWGVHAAPSTNADLSNGDASVLISWFLGGPSWNVSVGKVGGGANGAAGSNGYSLVCAAGSTKCALGTLQNTPAPGAFIPAGVNFSATIKVGQWGQALMSMPLTGLTCLQYLRVTNTSNYLSPYICHATVPNLAAKTTYFYTITAMVSGTSAMGPPNGTYTMPPNSYWSTSTKYKFTTPSPPSSGCSDERSCPSVYPVPLVLMGDTGQTYNSSMTAQLIAAYISSTPVQAVFNLGDYAYADLYDALNSYKSSISSESVSAMRWDTWAVMWQSVLGQALMVGVAGEHDAEYGFGKMASYKDNSTSYGFLTKDRRYPFQAWAARYPNGAMGASSYGDLWVPQYYSQDLGPVHLITMSSYVPFAQGTEQYNWLLQDISAVNRSAQPWLIVQLHAPMYHTNVAHYKEQECFRGIYEPIFYQNRVDFVLSGHVHAYERSHAVYNYKQDACGPVHLVVGGGGNIEGPNRNFMDEFVPGSPNVSYCQAASAGTIKAGVSQTGSWTASYQNNSQPPTCTTLSFQSAQAGTTAGLVPNPSDATTFWCQSKQPSWSAYRDSSFGFATLTLTSDNTAMYSWYRNSDQSPSTTAAVGLSAGDTTEYTRYTGPCAASTTTSTTTGTRPDVSHADQRTGWRASLAFAALASATFL